MPLYRGTGGAVFEITPPPEGSNQREHFDARVERGELVLVDDAPAEVAAPAVEDDPAGEATEPAEDAPKRRPGRPRKADPEV